MAVEVTKGATTGTPREGSTEQWVYMAEDAPATNRDLLGGKGAGLAAMTQAGLPVPPAFTITTAACNAYVRAGNQFPPGLWDQTLAALKRLEEKSGRKLGDAANPLLVSVRSGARESMPGMMDTVLNRGLNGSCSTCRLRSSITSSSRPSRRPARVRTPTSTPTTCDRWPSSSRTWSRRKPGSPSQPTSSNNSSWPSRPCSTRGWAGGPSIIATSSRSRTTWGPP